MRFMRKLFAKRPHRSSLEMVLGYNQRPWFNDGKNSNRDNH